MEPSSKLLKVTETKRCGASESAGARWQPMRPFLRRSIILSGRSGPVPGAKRERAFRGWLPRAAAPRGSAATNERSVRHPDLAVGLGELRGPLGFGLDDWPSPLRDRPEPALPERRGSRKPRFSGCAARWLAEAGAFARPFPHLSPQPPRPSQHLPHPRPAP